MLRQRCQRPNGAMQIDLLQNRRHFIRTMTSLSACALLAGCGGGGGVASSDTGIVPTPTASVPPVVPIVSGAHPLNLALTLAYLGAQFYGYASRGTGLSSDLTIGIGRSGAVTGARLATFDDAVVAGYAGELADDKHSHVVALRARIGALAAAQPALDLSASTEGAFTNAAQGTGFVGANGAFDPYASAEDFLFGAFLIENTVAAAYRTCLLQSDDASVVAIVTAHLADAIYHGGLIRTLLEDKAATNVAIGRAVSNVGLLLATLDGSNIGDQTLAGASGVSSNLLDDDGRPIPFTRTTAQVLKTLYLSSTSVGGFLPAGANGIAA